MHQYYVYILTNKSGTLYTGISRDVIARRDQHTQKVNAKSFTAKYNINKLIYYEEYATATEMILREKQIKNWSRKKKLDMIRKVNPKFEELLGKE